LLHPILVPVCSRRCRIDTERMFIDTRAVTFRPNGPRPRRTPYGSAAFRHTGAALGNATGRSRPFDPDTVHDGPPHLSYGQEPQPPANVPRNVSIKMQNLEVSVLDYPHVTGVGAKAVERTSQRGHVHLFGCRPNGLLRSSRTSLPILNLAGR
jgi:hypothetical protein